MEDIVTENKSPKNEIKIKQPKVSVIIPVYNTEKYLRQCLDSVVNQTLKDIEIIIVNDGSTDGSLKIINEYAKRDKRIVFFNEEHNNVSHATNVGLNSATGEYVARVDADDYIKPNMYEEMYKIAAENDLDVLRCDYANFTGEYDTFKQTAKKNFEERFSYLYNKIFNANDFLDKNSSEYLKIISTANVIWNSIYKLNFLRENNIRENENVNSWEDNSFYYWVMLTAKRIMYIDKIYVFHRRDNISSMTHDINKMSSDVFDEHKFLKEKLIEINKFEDFKIAYYRRKFGNYFFALKIIPYDMKREFIFKMADDFLEDLNNDIIENSEDNIFSKINFLVYDTDGFYRKYLDENYKVSVIMPVYNSEKFLRRTLDSVVNQTLKEIEIILIDDGSTDSTSQILCEYQQADELKRIIVITQKNSGAGAARNTGLKAAHGKYLAILDADDVFSPDMLFEAYTTAQICNAQICIFKCEEINSLTQEKKSLSYALNKNQMPVDYGKCFSAEKIKGNPFRFVNGWAWDKLFLREYITENNINFLELWCNNDSYFTYIALLKAVRIVAIDKYFVKRYVNHGLNLSSRYDNGWRNWVETNMVTRNKLIAMNCFDKLKMYFMEKILITLIWVLNTAIQTEEARAAFFDYLVGKGLEEFGFKDCDVNDFAPDLKKLYLITERMQKYKPGEYELFRDEQTFPEEIKGIEKDSGYIIFGFDNPPKNTSAPIFSIESGKNAWDTCIAVIDIVFLPNNKPSINDTLYIGMTYTPNEKGMCTLDVYQAEFEGDNKIFKDKLGYIISKDKFTVFLKYTGRVTGISFKVRSINSRSRHQPKFTIINDKPIIGLEQSLVLNKSFIPITQTRKKNELGYLYKKLYGIPENASDINVKQLFNGSEIPAGILVSYNINEKNIEFIIPAKENNNAKPPN